MSLISGTRLGPYEILSALGAGGTGEVYRAKDTRSYAKQIAEALEAAHEKSIVRRQRRKQIFAKGGVH